MMRAGVCVLVVLGLLVVLGEAFSVQHYQTQQEEEQQGNDGQDYYFDDNSLVSSEGQDDQTFIDDPEIAQLFSSEEDPDWIPDETQEDDGRFIAPESTEEGELWSSDEDPDWTPTQSQEEQSQNEDDYNSGEDYDGDDYSDENASLEEYGQEQQSQEEESQEPYSQEQQSQEPYSQEQQSQEDQSQQDSAPFPDIDEQPNAQYWSQKGGQDYYHKLSKRNVKYPQVVQVSSPYEDDWYKPEEEVSEGVEPLVPVYGPETDQVGDGVEPENVDGDGSRVGNWFRRGWRKLTDKVEDTVGYIGDKVDYVAGEVYKKLDGLDEKWDRIKNRFKSILKKFGILVQEGVKYCLRRFKYSYDQVRESEVIDKLQQKLDEGHAEVAKFFQILGQKIEVWRAEHRSEDIDEGLIGSYEQQQGQQEQEGEQYYDGQQQRMPDFYQDQDVVYQLNRLRDDGVLTQNDILILTSEHTNQQNQNYGQQQQ